MPNQQELRPAVGVVGDPRGDVSKLENVEGAIQRFHPIPWTLLETMPFPCPPLL